MDDSEQRVIEIQDCLRGRTDRADEERILSALAGASGRVLDLVLDRIDLAHLIGDVDDRAVGPKNRARLCELLCHDRLDDLSVPVRAKLVAAFSTGRTSRQDEHAILAIFLGTKGPALTALKNAIDTGDDHRDLQHLVYSDIDDPFVRGALLDHVDEQARGLPRSEVKVLSDIDDTFYCNWKDRRYPPKTVYPGVRQVYVELDRGPHEEPGRMGDLAFVTARPRDRAGLVEKATHETLRSLGLDSCTVLAGSLMHIHSSRAIATRKLENFVEYASLFPEYDFVLIGDSGQGDAAFGARMVEAEPERVKLVLIHDVVDTPASIRTEWARKQVTFFDTYIGAGAAALERGLIRPEGLIHIVDAAMRELAELELAPDARAARLAEHERDREGARQR